MKLINKIKLSLFYSELKKYGINSELLETALRDKNFAKIYKNEIKGFIEHLENYSYNEFADGTLTEMKLSPDKLANHLNNVLKNYNGTEKIKYINFVKNNFLENSNLENTEILNDPNFNKLFDILRYDIFNKSINEICLNGNSNKLLELLTKYPHMNISDLTPELFSEQVWNIVNSNYLIAEKPLLEMFNTKTKIEILIELINNNLLEGLKYTYENILESHSFINNQLGNSNITLKQFNLDFINNIGLDTLKNLYSRSSFSNEKEFTKIFEIASCGNFELIQDIVNYDPYGFSFKDIKAEDINKKLIESSTSYNKNEVLLNKYMGIQRGENHYIKLFLSSINKVDLPNEFKEKYEQLLNLLNQIYKANTEEIIELSNKISPDKKDEYKKLIYNLEQEGNDVIKEQFSKDLKNKNEEILNVATQSIIKTENGKDISVYELTGQPFTMLVHAITNNNLSSNNDIAAQIINNPALWNEFNEGNNHISTSLISDKYMMTYGTPDNEKTVMFGFSNVPSSSLKFTDINDVGINRDANANVDYNMRNRISIAQINTVATVDDLMEKTIQANIRKKPNSRMWNEIGLARTSDTTSDKLQPNYIVCMDHISESAKKAAEYFNIPIYLIHRENYKELPYIPHNDIELEENLTNLKR